MGLRTKLPLHLARLSHPSRWRFLHRITAASEEAIQIHLCLPTGISFSVTVPTKTERILSISKAPAWMEASRSDHLFSSAAARPVAATRSRANSHNYLAAPCSAYTASARTSDTELAQTTEQHGRARRR